MYYTNELYHHGILGQKWGVRRYQNPDGTLTAAGESRYGAHAERVYKKNLKEQLTRRFNSGNSKAGSLIKERWEKAEGIAKKTKESKQLDEIREIMSTLDKQVKEQHGPNAQVVYGKEFAEEYNQLVNSMRKTATDYMNKPEFRDKIASIYLSEMGYDDTIAGREYVKEIIGEFRYA